MIGERPQLSSEYEAQVMVSVAYEGPFHVTDSTSEVPTLFTYPRVNCVSGYLSSRLHTIEINIELYDDTMR